jgi:hypothetical protein
VEVLVLQVIQPPPPLLLLLLLLQRQPLTNFLSASVCQVV